VGLKQPDRDISTLRGHDLGLLEHAKCLADPDRHAKEDLVLPARDRELRH
jgi:hypothetical protein